MKVYLTTEYGKTSGHFFGNGKRVRRRKKIAEGALVRIGLAPIKRLDPAMSDERGSDAQALFVDGKPVAFVNPWSDGTEWLAIVDAWPRSGNGLRFEP